MFENYWFRIVCILVPYPCELSYCKIMVRFLISNPFLGAVLIRGRHLLEDDTFLIWVSIVQHLLEGGAYSRPGAY